jgi:transcriptional regulator with XRE-family HTH domain
MLKQLRLEKELTQEDVYNDTGIHIARIESGKGNVSISTLSKLLEYYKISLSQFFIKISE